MKLNCLRNDLTILIAVIGIARPGQAQQGSDSAAVAQAAATWLLLVDNGEYEAGWDQAAPAFQQAVSKVDWVRSVSQARAPFEPFGARRLTSAAFHETLPNAPPGPYVILLYRTEIARNGPVIETVVPMRLADGRWMLAGSFVRT